MLARALARDRPTEQRARTRAALEQPLAKQRSRDRRGLRPLVLLKLSSGAANAAGYRSSGKERSHETSGPRPSTLTRSTRARDVSGSVSGTSWPASGRWPFTTPVGARRRHTIGSTRCSFHEQAELSAAPSQPPQTSPVGRIQHRGAPSGERERLSARASLMPRRVLNAPIRSNRNSAAPSLGFRSVAGGEPWLGAAVSADRGARGGVSARAVATPETAVGS